MLGFGSRWYQKLLGHPLVYNRLRPWVVGGIDMTAFYESLETEGTDVIVDVGCGTGDALRYLPSFKAYYGFDIDARAIEFAWERAAGRPEVTFEARQVTSDDLASLRPSLVILAGLLHHMDDEPAVHLLELLAGTPSIRRIATQDVVYLPGERVSNMLARLDRGRYVREEDGYRALVERAGLRIESLRIARSQAESGRASYLIMTLAGPAETQRR
jgi:SAM-dependent methyltransferase